MKAKNTNSQKLNEIFRDETQGAIEAMQDAMQPFGRDIFELRAIVDRALASNNGWVLFTYRNALATMEREFKARLDAANLTVRRTKTSYIVDPDKIRD